MTKSPKYSKTLATLSDLYSQKRASCCGMRRVAVIGAGIAGLVTIKLMSEKPGEFDVVCYERQSVVGGEWRYMEDTTFTGDYRPNAIYKHLKTNSNRELSLLPGLSYPTDTPHWLGHAMVYQYILDYTRHFHLDEYIQCNTEVTNIKPLQTDDEANKWLVTVKSGSDGKESSGVFDCVVVCTGFFYKCVMPDIPGADAFSGDKIHSHAYRDPERYRDKTVLVVGRGPSGTDIFFELASYAEKVFITQKPLLRLTNNMEVTTSDRLRAFTHNSVVMADGAEIQVDHVIFCTGYAPRFPFLDETCGVTVIDKFVYPLYKLFVHPTRPTLFFNGLTRMDAHFNMVTMTAEIIMNLLLGLAKLPTAEKMLEDTERAIGKCREDMKTLGSLHNLTAYSRWPHEMCKLGNVEIPWENEEMFKVIQDFQTEGKFHQLRKTRFFINGQGKVLTEDIE